MNTPKQLKLPLQIAQPPRGPTLADVLRRLARVESRLVQLMKHQGMTHDGAADLPTDKDPGHG